MRVMNFSNNRPEESARDCNENLTFLNARVRKNFPETIGDDREGIMDHFQNPDFFWKNLKYLKENS